MNDFFKYEKEIYCDDTKETCFGYDEYLKSKHWKNLRTRLIGDNRICAICKQHKSAIQLHHLNYDRLGNESDSDLIPLCTRCHKKMHTKNSFSADDIYDIAFRRNNSGHVRVNKNLLHNLGHEAAIVYSELIRSYCYYESNGKLTNDGYFFCTVEMLEDECAVSRGQQQRILKKLSDMGLLKTELRGMPRIRYVKLLLDEEAVGRAFADYVKKSVEKNSIPYYVYEKYSKPFDFEIFKRQLETICKSIGRLNELDNLESVFSVYFDFFGYPQKYFNRDSLEMLVYRIMLCQSDYGIYDTEIMGEYCEEYSTMKMESNGYERSIYHLFSDGIMDILSLRLK